MSMDGRRCLVTGAAGFIGSHLCRRLVGQGAEVHALVRPGTSLDRLSDLEGQMELHRVDLEDGDAVFAALENAEPQIVFHLATPTRFSEGGAVANAGASVDKILKPLVSLVESLAALPEPPENLVRAGTIAEYGNSAFPYREEQREAPVTAYGTAMLAGTHYLALLQDDLLFPTVTARLGLTYGEGQSQDFFVPSLFHACRTGQPIRVQRPEDRRDLIHVDDVVDALILMGRNALPGARHVNISTGQAPTMAQVASLVTELVGCNHALVETASISHAYRPSILLSDPALASQIYGWKSRIGIARGLQMLAESQAEQTSTLRQHHA